MLTEKQKLHLDKIHKKLKGRKLSDEHKRKISQSEKGKIVTDEQRKNMSISHIGHKETLETRLKRSKIAKEKGFGKWMKGKKLSVVTRKKISSHFKGKPFTGEKCDWNGRRHSNEAKRRMSEAHKGEKSYFWKGGISYEPYSIDWTKTLKRSIRERDHYTCYVCGKEPAVYVHHIDYDKKNCNSENLITLCISCHAKTNNNRNYWQEFFKQKISLNKLCKK